MYYEETERASDHIGISEREGGRKSDEVNRIAVVQDRKRAIIHLTWPLPKPVAIGGGARVSVDRRMVLERESTHCPQSSELLVTLELAEERWNASACAPGNSGSGSRPAIWLA